jgi:hypothetical protein
LEHVKEYPDVAKIRGDGSFNNFGNGNPGGGRSEGIGGTSANVIWPLRLQNVFCSFLKEGFTGHGGPLAGRTLFGVSYMGNGNSMAVRIKWSSKSAFKNGDYYLL